MDFLDILRSDGSIVVNKSLAKIIGIDAAIIFSEIVSKYKYHQDRNELVEGKWFYFTEDKLEENTTFKRSVQDKAIKRLVDLGLIVKKIMGIPSKRYFTLCKDAILLFLKMYLEKPEKIEQLQAKQEGRVSDTKDVEEQQPRVLESNTQDCSNPSTNNTNVYKTINNTKNNKNLSISKDKVSMLAVSEPVKIMIRAYQDRLIDLDLISIQRLFNMQIVTEKQFEEVLSNVLASSYDDLYKYLRKSLYTAKRAEERNIYLNNRNNLIPYQSRNKELWDQHGLPNYDRMRDLNAQNTVLPLKAVSGDFINNQAKAAQSDTLSPEQELIAKELLLALGEI